MNESEYNYILHCERRFPHPSSQPGGPRQHELARVFLSSLLLPSFPFTFSFDTLHCVEPIHGWYPPKSSLEPDSSITGGYGTGAGTAHWRLERERERGMAATSPWAFLFILRCTGFLVWQHHSEFGKDLHCTSLRRHVHAPSPVDWGSCLHFSLTTTELVHGIPGVFGFAGLGHVCRISRYKLDKTDRPIENSHLPLTSCFLVM